MAKRKTFSINRSLSQGLEDTMSAAETYSGELRVDVVPLHRLDLDPENPRQLALTLEDAKEGVKTSDLKYESKQEEWQSLQSLSKSIINQGVINPVVVYKHDDRYRLIAGERRTLASLIAKKDNIQAKILSSKPTELNRTILQWMENIEREDLSLWERIRNIQSILKAYALEHDKPLEKVTGTQLSELVGISTSQGAQYKTIMSASDILLAAIRDDFVSNLDKAAFIAKNPEQAQQSLITLCRQGATLKELKSASQQRASINPPTKQISGPKVTLRDPQVIHMLMEAVLAMPEYSHLRGKTLAAVDLTKPKSIERAFNCLMKKLEETVA